MLSCLRRSARALSVLALLAFLAPAAAADCREISALTGSAMACCTGPIDDPGFWADCCAMGGDWPASERPASTAASARASSEALATAAPAVMLGEPILTPSLSAFQLLDPDSPPDRLYIRFGVIRR
jgi:hypothetical protein